MSNEKEHLHHSFARFRDPTVLVLSGNTEHALLNNLVYREGFPKLRQKSQVLKLNVQLTGRVTASK